eukprot:CAMPEP_0118952146 /NCGR_PEP_ID=MMETSP1169-20130426/54352_1 /TAXON_ID=36882 /ORGANISM="Pyramimonas obovata, Strain CCMP722" /LENGTH=264 /DNA_ID=CAMNT_0006899325 /DNA_START=58 /DNA_END=849 /DNA_ORIENTATION=+
MPEAEDHEWLYEAVIRYLQGPMYSTPLMGFIDEQCVIFDTEEENKLEYTTIHENFKKLVDTLITDYLMELGIPEQKFSEVIATSVHKELNNFVLASILTVDDFMQFKAMMVKRNVDLTHEVLNAHAEAAERSASLGAVEAPPQPEDADYDDEEDGELQEVLRLSKEQFALESTRIIVPDNVPEGAEADDEMAQVMKMSMMDQKAMELDQERAELEQAIQLSLSLEQESQRLIREEKAQIESLTASSSSASSAPPASALALNASI